MKDFKIKMQILFKPFFLINISLLICYTFLHWLLLVHFHVIEIREDLANGGIPILLPIIPVFVFTRKQIKILKKGGYRNMRLAVQFNACSTMFIPLTIAQSYMVTATGKLTSLNDIQNINSSKPTKYYSLRHYYVDKNRAGEYSVSSGSGKYYSIYFVLPIWPDIKDTSSPSCNAWLAVSYFKRISNRISQEKKDAEYKQFVYTSSEDFKTKNVQDFSYLERLGSTVESKYYKSAINNSRIFDEGHKTILLPAHNSFESRNGNKLLWLIISIIGGTMFQVLILLLPEVDENQLQIYQKLKST